MRNKLLILICFMLLCITSGCTDNVKVKAWGGKATLNLPKNQKLVQMTWKDVNLWILTRPMKADETPETYSFKEQSSFSMVEGEYIIIENR